MFILIILQKHCMTQNYGNVKTLQLEQNVSLMLNLLSINHICSFTVLQLVLSHCLGFFLFFCIVPLFMLTMFTVSQKLGKTVEQQKTKVTDICLSN